MLDVEQYRLDNRMNDGGCDRQGRLLASSMNLATPRAPTGACWRFSADQSVERVADGLHIGNGVAFSPAGDRFFLADTTEQKVWVHSYDGRTGAIGERSVFVDLAQREGLPDGATVDAEGFYWLAAVRGGCLYRFAPDGRLDRTVRFRCPYPAGRCSAGGSRPPVRDVYPRGRGGTVRRSLRGGRPGLQWAAGAALRRLTDYRLRFGSSGCWSAA